MFSALLLFFLIIPMAVLGLLICTTSEGGMIFKQERVGMNGRIFFCYKFRTMYKSAPNDMPTAQFSNASDYITPIGRFLRKSSLDELPQLVNVLIGDMSLVGPRPLIPREGEIHSYRMRCGAYRIRPGMTGLAQINGRDMLGDIEKVRFDDELIINFCIGVSNFKLPVLTVQPIVENAVKHGTSKKEGVSNLYISTRETDAFYEIEIRDTGVGFDASIPRQDDGHKHIGISNVRQRLETLCNGTLTIESTPGVGTTALIKIPKTEESSK